MGVYPLWSASSVLHAGIKRGRIEEINSPSELQVQRGLLIELLQVLGEN